MFKKLAALGAVLVVLASCSRSSALESAMEDASEKLPVAVSDGVNVVSLSYDKDGECAVYGVEVNEDVYGSDVIEAYRGARDAAPGVVLQPLARHTGVLGDVIDETVDLDCPVKIVIKARTPGTPSI